MLRINPISFGQVNGNKKQKSAESRGKINFSSNPVTNFSLGVSPHSYVSFKGSDYGKYDRVIEDRFKLPQGCAADDYQKDSALSIEKGNDTLVTAPTGTGKTAIAMYAISKNIEEGKRTFYTTPLKALSNEKYRQLQKTYGKENVGILTGDVKINADAPIVVMTTEIYRNMVFGDKFGEDKDRLENLKTVIFDELHYLGDVDRGGTWEQSIILTPPEVQLLSLSATIGNNTEINDWITKIRAQKSELINVPPEKRHVPLFFDNVAVHPKKVGFVKKGKPEKGSKSDKNAGAELKPAKMNQAPDNVEYLRMVDILRSKDRLPAIFFVFSKKSSKDLLEQFKEKGRDLNSSSDKRIIQETIDRYKKEGKYLGETLDIYALKKGYAVHNSGLLPTQKELIEELFNKKLIKVVLATETLAAGINMPARTVVISSDRKPTDPKSADRNASGEIIDGKRKLTVNEFHQMAGRAGRRGIDTKGYVYTMSTSKEQASDFEDLVKTKPIDIKSTFIPSYSFIVGYYSHTDSDKIMKKILSKTLNAYDENPDIAGDKAKIIMRDFTERKKVLQKFGYLDEENNLSDKGKLLCKLNGYEQIPLVDIVSSKSLSSMSPEELAASVASIAHTNENVAASEEREREFQIKKNKQKGLNTKYSAPRYEHENPVLVEFVERFDNYLKRYNQIMSPTTNFLKVAQDKNSSKHIYNWAELNRKNSDSRKNWKTLCEAQTNNFIDEGYLFKEITQTIDLLKQITKIADVGKKISEDPNDKFYYSELNSRAQSAIRLLYKEPICEAE